MQVNGYPFAALPEKERDRFLSKWTALLNAAAGRARVSVYAMWDAVEGFRFRRLLFFTEGLDPGLLAQLGYEPRPAAEPYRPRPVKATRGLLELEDGSYARAYTVMRLPDSLPEAWPLELGYAADEVHLLLEPVEPARARGMLDRKLSMLMSAQQGSVTWQLESEAYRLQQLQQLLGGKARLVKIAIVIIVRGSSLGEVRERARRLEELLSSRMVEYASGPGFYQRRLYNLEWTVPVFHYIDTLSAQALYPLVQEQLADFGGFYLGYDLDTGEPVVYNPYARPNYNVVVLGESGSGKSMTLKVYVRRWWAAGLGQQVIIVDPEGEYVGIREYLATGLAGYELSKDAAEERGGLGLDPVKLYRRGVIGLDEAVDVVQEFYRVPDELRGELVEAVSESESVLGAARLAEERGTGLERYLKAAGADSWIYEGEPPLPTGRGAVYTLAGIRSRRARALVGALLALVVSSRLRNSLLVVDEGWMFAQYPALMAMFADIARRGRKRGVNFVFASQRPHDVLRSEHGRTILEQSATVLLLRLNEASLEAVKPIYNLSEAEEEQLLDAEPGQGILRVAGGWRLRVYVQPTPEELRVFSTRPGEW
ncbi:VirB4 family type IV secretion system protein [Pyrodictium abyssi]|uniref:VirB4 family type IV secretion system protein n=1 Tax=Pyrodictium abyssi TaxID=54256 RepID=UPI0030C6A3B9